jgi:hypothetical protein
MYTQGVSRKYEKFAQKHTYLMYIHVLNVLLRTYAVIFENYEQWRRFFGQLDTFARSNLQDTVSWILCLISIVRWFSYLNSSYYNELEELVRNNFVTFLWLIHSDYNFGSVVG